VDPAVKHLAFAKNLILYVENMSSCYSKLAEFVRSSAHWTGYNGINRRINKVRNEVVNANVPAMNDKIV
jgi:hypothetical protein